VLDNVAALAPVLKEQLEGLKQRHPAVKGYRNIGLFGIVELQKNSAGDPYVQYNGPAHPAMGQLCADFLAGGLYTLLRWSSFFTNPPLTISKAELLEGFQIIDKALSTLDRTFQK
jgi:taurine---2-oxoglutarate transaminase